MRIAYSPEQERLRDELRSYFAALMTPDRFEALAASEGDHGDVEVYKDTVRQLGKDGWLTLNWPVEYGGRGATPLEHLIFTDEVAASGVPFPVLTVNTVGPTLMQFGTDEQKSYFLPRIASGDVHFSIGYSEPDAGTDLAALRTTAVRDGDDFVINGHKMWTSLIKYADYVWLACRTNPDVPKHRGLSIFVVPTDAPGFSWTAVPTLSGETTSATYYSDVRVPASSLVGEIDKGWPLITNQLNRERVALTPSASVARTLNDVRDWAQQTHLPDGRRVIDQEWVRLHLARAHAKLQFIRLKNWQIASGAAVSPADSSATKVFGTEFVLEAYRGFMEILGANGTLRAGSPAAVLHGRVERSFRVALVMTFGAGTNEVQRDIIAGAGLGLPASRR